MIIDYNDSTYEDEIPLSVYAEIIMLITIFVALPLILPLGTIILLVLRIRQVLWKKYVDRAAENHTCHMNKEDWSLLMRGYPGSLAPTKLHQKKGKENVISNKEKNDSL